MASNPQEMNEKIRKAKLKQLLEEWAFEKVKQSNIGIAANAHISLKEKKFLKFKFKLSDGTRVNLETKHLDENNRTLYLIPATLGPSGSAYKENKQLISSKSMKFENPSNKEIERDYELKSDYENLHETEHTNTSSDSLDLGIGASAYGAEAKVGYKTEWSVTDKDKKSIKNNQGTSVKIPIVIPAGGATYTFNYYRESVLQDYGVSLFLRGHVEIIFSNANQISYSNGKFVIGNDKVKFLHDNKIRLSIVTIFKDLMTAVKFPKSSHWQFDDAKDIVSYQDIISKLQFFGVDIDTTAQIKVVNSPVAPAAGAQHSTTKIIDSMAANQPQHSNDPSQRLPKVNVKTVNAAVVMPDHLAKTTFAEDIKKQLAEGMKSKPEYKELLKCLVNPDYKDHIVFLKEQMEAMRKEVKDPNFSAYLEYTEKNIQNFKFDADFERLTATAYVTDTEAAKKKETPQESLPPPSEIKKDEPAGRKSPGP